MPAFGQTGGGGVMRPGMGAPNAPWWASGGQQQRATLEQQAPQGYAYDPVQERYGRTPQSVGERAGQAIQALRAQVPDLFDPNYSRSSFSGMPNLPYPSGSGGAPTVPQVQMPDTSAARAAAFARAKDQVGLTSRGAITGLQQVMGARGGLGGSQERRGVAQVVGQGQRELGDVSRGQAISDAELAQRAAELSYQGGITQRGQDIQAQQAANELALRQWLAQQEAGSRYSQQQSQSLTGLLGALGGQLY